MKILRERKFLKTYLNGLETIILNIINDKGKWGISNIINIFLSTFYERILKINIIRSYIFCRHQTKFSEVYHN